MRLARTRGQFVLPTTFADASAINNRRLEHLNRNRRSGLKHLRDVSRRHFAGDRALHQPRLQIVGAIHKVADQTLQLAHRITRCVCAHHVPLRDRKLLRVHYF